MSMQENISYSPKSKNNDMYDSYIIHVNDFANTMYALSVGTRRMSMSDAAVEDDIYDFEII